MAELGLPDAASLAGFLRSLSPWPELGLAVGAVLLSLLAALLERSGPIRLRHWAEAAGDSLRRLYGERARFQAFRLILSWLATILPVLLLALLLLEGSALSAWQAVSLVVLLLGVAEWLNRRIVERWSEAALGRLTWLLRPANALLSPLTWLFAHYGGLAERSAEEPDDEASEDEIQAFIDVGRREGILEPEEGEMLLSIFDFGDTRVRSVMTPRVEMVAATADSNAETLADLFFESKHSRLPLYRDSVDQVIGVLHIRDLFEAMHSGQVGKVEELAKDPYFVPESKPLRELLQELQDRAQQIAIVVDEYGGVAGLVTVEDLLEEIVGEISDEHDEDEPQPEQLVEGGYRLDGRTELEELSELFQLEIEDLPYETVSGLICGELGYVPEPKEVYRSHGLVFEVDAADARKVTQVRVQVATEADSEPLLEARGAAEVVEPAG